MKATEHEFVIDHILESAENLKIARDVARAYPEARSRLIGEFFAKLEARAREDFGDGALEIQNGFRDPPFEAFTTFVVRKSTWPEGVGVGISAERTDAREFLLGVARGDHDVTVPPRIHETLSERVRPGKATEWWPWWYWLDDPYRNWEEEEALTAIREDDHLTEELYAELRAVVLAADPILASNTAD